jgi:hypothetical protein
MPAGVMRAGVMRLAVRRRRTVMSKGESGGGAEKPGD